MRNVKTIDHSKKCVGKHPVRCATRRANRAKRNSQQKGK